MKEKTFRNLRMEGWRKARNGTRLTALALALALSAFSVWTVCYRFGREAPAYLPEASETSTVILLFLAFAVIFLCWRFGTEKRKSGAALAAALALSLFYAVGSFVLTDPDKLESITLLRLAFRVFGMLPVFYCALCVLFSVLDSFRGSNDSRNPEQRKQVRRSLELILLLLWMPFMIGCFPGNMTADTIKSVRSFQDPLQGQNMPWFLNLLYGGTLLLGERLGNANGALFVFCLLQALLLTVGLSGLLSRLWSLGVPRSLLMLLLLLFGILPVFPTYAFCTMKDVLFALGLVFFCDAGAGILGDPEAGKKEWLELGLSAIFTAGTRNGAAWMMILSLAGFFVLYKKWRGMLTIAAGVLLVCSLAVPKLMGQPASQLRENLSLPIQQTARVIKLYEEELSREETNQYKKIMTLKQWRRYKAGISDPVKKYFSGEPTDRYLKDFAALWWKELKQHPYAYLEATLLMNYAYYVPPADRSDLKPRLFLGTERFSTEKVEELTTLTENTNPGMGIIRQFYDFLNGVPVIRLLQRIGLYTWLMVTALIYGLSRPARRRWLLLLLPELIVLIGCCFSPVNGHLRYAFPFMLCGPPAVLAVFFAVRGAGTDAACR